MKVRDYETGNVENYSTFAITDITDQPVLNGTQATDTAFVYLAKKKDTFRRRLIITH